MQSTVVAVLLTSGLDQAVVNLTEGCADVRQCNSARSTLLLNVKLLHREPPNPNNSQHLLCFCGPSGLVKTSASMSSVGQYCKLISFLAHSSYTKRCFVSICLDRRLCLSLWTKVRQDWLSSIMVVEFTCCSPND